MTRKEQIVEAGIDFTESHNPTVICGGALSEENRFLNRNRSFEEGATWADKNPYWNTEKNPKKIDTYLVALVSETNPDDIVFDLLLFISNGWVINDNHTGYMIVGWMELPKPPKFD